MSATRREVIDGASDDKHSDIPSPMRLVTGHSGSCNCNGATEIVQLPSLADLHDLRHQNKVYLNRIHTLEFMRSTDATQQRLELTYAEYARDKAMEEAACHRVRIMELENTVETVKRDGWSNRLELWEMGEELKHANMAAEREGTIIREQAIEIWKRDKKIDEQEEEIARKNRDIEQKAAKIAALEKYIARQRSNSWGNRISRPYGY